MMLDELLRALDLLDEQDDLPPLLRRLALRLCGPLGERLARCLRVVSVRAAPVVAEDVFHGVLPVEQLCAQVVGPVLR